MISQSWPSSLLGQKHSQPSVQVKYLIHVDNSLGNFNTISLLYNYYPALQIYISLLNHMLISMWLCYNIVCQACCKICLIDMMVTLLMLKAALLGCIMWSNKQNKTTNYNTVNNLTWFTTMWGGGGGGRNNLEKWPEQSFELFSQASVQQMSACPV